jgi:hypothetical protein
MIRRNLLLSIILACLPVGLPAQSTAPVWAKPDLFWYRREVSGGNVWLKVDAQHGVKEPLFDHQRLAIELSLRTGDEYTPLTLPFADPAMQFVVKYDGSNAYIQQGAMAIEFTYKNNHWRCDLQIKWDWNRVPPTDYECLARRPAASGQATLPPAVTRSPDGKWEALIENHNVAVRPVGSTSTTPLTTDGTAAFPYQHGSLIWSGDSKSLAGYRVNSQVWLSDGLHGNVKKDVNRGQWTVPSGT